MSDASPPIPAPASPTTAPPAAPDWAAIHHEIRCPLCDYNLRGLVEPRCPECGHLSEWRALLDPDYGLHPWLFEHRRSHRIRAFARTFLASQLPQKFWAAVRPTHEPRERKLVLYWIAVLMLLLGPVLLILGLSIASTYWNVYQARQRIWQYATQATDPRLIAVIQASGGANAYAARFSPPYPTPLDLVRGRSPFGAMSYHPEIFVPALVALIAWPWLTAFTMAIFRQTMRRASIHPVHILRCAIYSADVCIVLALIVVPLLWFNAPSSYDWSWTRYGARLFIPSMLLPLMACELVLMYRLMLAYTRYLALPQAVATVLASQAIVVLLCLALYLILAPM